MATSPLIPKEQLSAYQRWELGSFDAAPPQPKLDPAQVAAANAERVRQIDERARAEGYAAGHREGFDAGLREAAAISNARVARIDEVLQELSNDLTRFDREFAQEVVNLGLAVARKMIGESLKVRPEAVRVSVEEALRHVAHFRGPVTLAVNPEDAPLVRGYLDAAPPQHGWSVREDPLVAAGGCRVETAAGEVDATLEQRWHRITAALGHPLNWVD
jgi:flagellar assembly protein FliH